MAFEGPRQIADPADENIINLGLFQLKDHQGSAQFVFGIPDIAQGGLSVGRFTGPVLRLGDPQYFGANAQAGIEADPDGLHPGGGADVNLLGIVSTSAGVDGVVGSRLGVHPYAGVGVGPLRADANADAGIGPEGLRVGVNGGLSASGAALETYPAPLAPPVEVAAKVAPAYQAAPARIEQTRLPEPFSVPAYDHYLSEAMTRILDQTSVTVQRGEKTWADVARRLAPGADRETIAHEAAQLRELNAPHRHLKPGMKLLTVETNSAYAQARVIANSHFSSQPPQA